MKSSDYFKKSAQEEENDLKALGLLTRALRAERCEKFSVWLPILEKQYDVKERDNGSYTITTQKFGILDYFPKANNLLIRKENKWKKPGLRWMIKNIIK